MKRRFLIVLLVALSLLVLSPGHKVAAGAVDPQGDAAQTVRKGNLDFHTFDRDLLNEVRSGISSHNGETGEADSQGEEDSEDDFHNVQVNDPSLDHIQTFGGTRPFEFSIQSETSIAAFGDHILIGYNSASDSPVVQIGGGLFFDHIHFSAFSVSHDGGRTWTSGFVPPVPGSPVTAGDPSVGVNRRGNFFYASLGTDAAGAFGLIVNKFTNRGRTVAPAVVAALDNGADKDWLAVGRDPFNKKQDNVYLAWTSFQAASSQLRFTKSTDGGATWSPQKILFAPVDTGGVMSAFIQFANPVVDADTGRLYIPFLHFSNIDADFIKVLVSDDAGETFRFLEFNVPGAPDVFGFPTVTPGTLSDCGRPGGGLRLVLHQGSNLGGGRFGLPRFRQSTRLITQPSAAAAEGKLFIAFTSSTSPFFGDPDSRSEIHLLFSANGGRTFRGPFTIAAATERDPQHVLPSISVDEDGEEVSVAYYVQQGDGKFRVDLTSGEIAGNGRRFHADAPVRVSTGSFDLIPSNNPIPSTTAPFRTTNYDRIVVACYNLGEYLSISQNDDDVLAAWGDNRNPWTSPVGSPAAGTHAQPDVFFQEVDADD